MTDFPQSSDSRPPAGGPTPKATTPPVEAARTPDGQLAGPTRTTDGPRAAASQPSKATPPAAGRPSGSPPPVDGRTVRFAHRRKELLGGAVAYALEFGVTDLSMRKLAQSLGISHTALAHHFGSKEALIFEIFEQLRKASVAAQAAGQRDGDPAGLLDHYAAWWTKWSAPPYIPALRLVFEVLGLAMRNPEQYAEFVAAPAQNWLDFLIPALRANHCPEDEVEAMATALMVFTTGLQVDLLLSDDRERIDAAHALFLSMVEERRQRWLRDAGVADRGSLSSR